MARETFNSWESRAEVNSFFGFTDLPTIAERGSVIISHGEGPYVFDVHGSKYLDANSGLWNMVAGFDHPHLTAAAKAQYDRFPGYHAFFGRMADTTVALSERLIEVSPFERGRVFYTNSGSEANDTLVKMLWFLAKADGQPQRRKILTRKNGYHGVTAVSASMTGKLYNAEFGLPLDGFVHLTCPHYWREAKEDESEIEFSSRLAQELEDTITREGPETIAAFVAEPVLGAGGVIPPPDAYFQKIQPVLERHGIPLIADEVICGFGRTGAVWGCEAYDFQPDAIIASKALTAGYFPMGAVILGPSLADRLQEAAEAIEEFPHGFTGSGHPVGSAIALAAIELILQGTDESAPLMENVARVIPVFEDGLQSFLSHPHIGEARGKGLMGALEVVQSKEAREPFPASFSISERIANTCTDNGLICRPLGQSIVLCPPFTMNAAQMSEMFEKLSSSLDQVFETI